MLLLLLAACLAAPAIGRPEAEPAADGDPGVWQELRGALPEEIASHAEQAGLANKRLFQNTVVQKLHFQVVGDSQAIRARQKILSEYISCSCPECKDEDHVVAVNKVDAARQLLPFNIPNPFHIITHPQEVLAELFQSCETKTVLETVKLLRENLREVQLRNQQLASLISCHCPHAARCRRVLDPLVFSIVTGRNDSELERAYWQSELEGFPAVVMERGIVDRLTSAASSILTYFFQSSRPQHDQQLSPLQSPPAAGIFAPGVDPHDWDKRPLPPAECPSLQVNITNSKNGQTEVSVSNHTATSL